MKTLSKAFKGLPTFTTLAALLWLAPMAGQAQDYTYEINNGTITITKYTGPGGDVTIPSSIDGLPVRTIGDWAFLNCSSLAAVTIPNSVTTIGYGALQYCSSLNSVTIPNSVTSIGPGAFYQCPLLSVWPETRVF